MHWPEHAPSKAKGCCGRSENGSFGLNNAINNVKPMVFYVLQVKTNIEYNFEKNMTAKTRWYNFKLVAKNDEVYCFNEPTILVPAKIMGNSFLI